MKIEIQFLSKSKQIRVLQKELKEKEAAINIHEKLYNDAQFLYNSASERAYEYEKKFEIALNIILTLQKNIHEKNVLLSLEPELQQINLTTQAQ